MILNDEYKAQVEGIPTPPTTTSKYLCDNHFWQTYDNI